MKNIFRILLACAWFAAAAAGCTESPRTAARQAVPERVLGVYRLYPSCKIPPPTPDGYSACYISHYGRHGSRFLLEETPYRRVRDVLARAEADGRLTEAGERAYAELLGVWPQFEGRAGELTSVGADQHRAIARRMAERQGSVFAANGVVRASASATSRTQESMEAFCGQLQTSFPHIRIVQTTDAALNPYSAASGIPRPDDLRTKSPEAEWRPEFDRFCRQRLDTPTFCRRIFTDTAYAAGLCEPADFERDFYHLAIHFAGCGMDIDWLRLFPLDELTALAECDAYVFYQEKGPSDRTSDRTWALSAHILRKILADAESAAAEGIAADLRFGHDGCIMSLLTLMQVDGWTERTTVPAEAARMWDVSQIPMACNLQWIFYRPCQDGGETLVRILLNEAPLRLPVTDRTGLCPWATMKRFLEERCAAAFAILDEDDTNISKSNLIH